MRAVLIAVMIVTAEDNWTSQLGTPDQLRKKLDSESLTAADAKLFLIGSADIKTAKDARYCYEVSGVFQSVAALANSDEEAAFGRIFEPYRDSFLSRGEECAKKWTTLAPNSEVAWQNLASVLSIPGVRTDAELRARQAQAVNAARKAWELNGGDAVALNDLIRIGRGQLSADEILQLERRLMQLTKVEQTTGHASVSYIFALRAAGRVAEYQREVSRLWKTIRKCGQLYFVPDGQPDQFLSETAGLAVMIANSEKRFDEEQRLRKLIATCDWKIYSDLVQQNWQLLPPPVAMTDPHFNLSDYSPGLRSALEVTIRNEINNYAPEIRARLQTQLKTNATPSATQ